MKPAEKEAEMQKFVSGETQILVATTVIEVGVNVPNASVMVILDAQRFGLSQLHQLRGRVGRLRPEDCPMFSHRCTPEDPVGPCMVSSEGACAAAYKYRGS